MHELVKYEAADGQMVQFTADDVRARLCPNIEEKELAFVMALCAAQKLNPFIKDVHKCCRKFDLLSGKKG